ncbi:Uncharacterised protein [Edwardsiella tarda]|nr:Uncharacterised protein [Edwardsiella tarda]
MTSLLHLLPHYIRNAERSQLHHYLFSAAAGCRQLCRRERRDRRPRGEAKSTLVTQLFTLWCVIRGIKHYPVIIMDSIDQAYPMLEAIKAN